MSTTSDGWLDRYPTRADASAAWEALAAEVAALADAGQPATGQPAAVPATRGRLVIVGSGIEAVGFTSSATQAIDEADRVFYCVADPATQLWIRRRRPDAYDLYVLYEDTKPRYHTYVQMSEAMLHYVRRGETVTAVFYGHPGIFALSTHRSLRIAQREGHEATMQPGVSALDCLCADLSVDPSYPGMATFEATEMLLRGRVPDPTLHVVLWQVGVIGEQGYRRRGFTNAKFPLLIEYLERFYPADAPAVHYIAARYPTLSPVIEHYELAELAKPRNFAGINGISTLYLPPAKTATQDPEMAARLGFAGAAAAPFPAQRTVDSYDQRERSALRNLAGFTVPADYQYQRPTRAAQFILELTEHPQLREHFRKRPGYAVSSASYPGLNAWERRMLATRDSGRMQVAAKQARLAASPAEQFVIDMYSNQALVRQFLQVTKANFKGPHPRDTINHWLSEHGYQTTIRDVHAAEAAVTATMLLAWTGVYTSADGTLTVTVLGDPVTNDNSLVFVNASRITGFTFAASTLSWAASASNPVSGSLAFSAPVPSGSAPVTRTVAGTIWPSGASEPASPNASLTETVPGTNPLPVWVGQYTTTTAGAPGPEVLVTATPPAKGAPGVSVAVGGTPVPEYAFEGRTLTWASGSLTFAAGNQPGAMKFSGMVNGQAVTGASNPAYTGPYEGQYQASQLVNGVWTKLAGVFYDGSTLSVGKQKITGSDWTSGALTWQNASGQYDSGRLQFFIDPLTYLASFLGFAWARGAAQPDKPNIRGTVSVGYLSSWSGSYPTSYAGGTAGPTMTIEGAPPPGQASVAVGGTAAGGIAYFSSQLTGSVGNDSFDVDFALAAGGARTFDGTYNTQGWSSKGSSAAPNQWIGTYSTFSVDQHGTFSPDPAVLSIAVTGASVTVTVTDGAASGTVAKPVFDPRYSTITWAGETAVPARFANASIALAVDTATSYNAFIGSYWPGGGSPPNHAIWRGTSAPAVVPPSDGGLSGGGIAGIVLGTLAAGLLGTGYLLWRTGRLSCQGWSCFRGEYQAVEVCDKIKMNLAGPTAVSIAPGPEAALGLSPCEEAEEEADEGDEAYEAEESCADEANPADLPQTGGQEPVFEEPNVDTDVDVDVDVDVDIDVDTDVDTDVDVDVDVDIDIDVDVDFIAVVDVDVDIDIDIDTDVDTVVDNVTDNVTDTVVDNVSIIETVAATAATETAPAELGQEGQTDPS